MINKNTNQADVTTVLATIGSSRSAPYRSFFNCVSDEQVLGAYLWGQAVSNALWPCLSMYEVVLRNSIHMAASRYSSHGKSVSTAWYDQRGDGCLKTTSKGAKQIDEILDKSPGLSPDGVIASLSFGFWPSFLRGLAKKDRAHILVATFAYHPHSKVAHWSYQDNVTKLVDTLVMIQNLRNAVAHLEPIWKPHRLKLKSTASLGEVVQTLQNRHEHIIETMNWCCPASAVAAQHGYANRVFKHLCSERAAEEFMKSPFHAGELVEWDPPARSVLGDLLIT
jgi:hypothetical protein